MTDLLDDIYSSFIWMSLIAFILLFFFIFLATKKPFNNNNFNKFYKVLMYLFSVAFFITIPVFNYGHARAFEKIFFGKTTICLFERSIRAVGKSAGKPARISILDKETGKRKERFSAGKPGNMIALHNDTLCYMDENDVVLYDAADLKEIYRIKEDGWGSILPELSIGIEYISVSNETVDQVVSHFIKLDCLNGKKYWFEPFSKTIYTKEPATTYVPAFASRSSELILRFGEYKELKYLYTSTNGEGSLQAIFPGPDAANLFTRIDSTGYIGPFLLCIDTLKKVFVFGHYTTTKKEEYFLEAKDFNYTTLWKKTNTELVDSSKNPEIGVCRYFNGILYFSIGGYFFATDPSTFNIYWKMHL